MSTIVKAPRKPSEFIAEAPDAKKKKDAAKPARKVMSTTQITLTVADDLLGRIDDMAAETGQSRSGLIKIGMIRLLRDGI
jgi:hypothetical protein